MSTHRNTPKAAVGFSLVSGLSPAQRIAWDEAHTRLLRHFPWLRSAELTIGASTLRLWSHDSPASAVHTTAAGDTLVLVGSPLKGVPWPEVEPQLAPERIERFVPPWDGRSGMLRISADGARWDVWNDWLACLPIYRADWAGGGIVTSIEPVAVQVAELTPEQFSRRGLTAMMLLGQFLGGDTLYEPLRYQTPDTHARFSRGAFQGERRLWSWRATDERYGDDPRALIRDWHDLHVEAIEAPLRADEGSLMIPLSSGMDSRMIIAVAADYARRSGRLLRTITYGPIESVEVAIGRTVAQVLGLPWERVDVGQDYMGRTMPQWLDWFGTSFHAHGMYQFPFLEVIAGKRFVMPGGNLGNSVGGGGHPSPHFFDETRPMIERYRLAFPAFWPTHELSAVLAYDPKPYLDELNAMLLDQLALLSDWPVYAATNLMNVWNRIGRAIYYQPMMYSYYGIDSSPFMHRELVAFSFSLPPALHGKRKLQAEMLSAYWPALGAIPAPPYVHPMRGITNKWHSLRMRLARVTPPRYRPIFGVTRVTQNDFDSIRKHGWGAIGPLSPRLADAGPLRAEAITRAADAAMRGDKGSVNKVLAAIPVVAALQGQPHAQLTC